MSRGFYKMINWHPIQLIHQVDEGGETWMLDGVGKATGKEAGLDKVGWVWIRGKKGSGPGIWETKNKEQINYCIAKGIPMIESDLNREMKS